MKQIKVGVLIGRFQVPEMHEGHRFLVREMLEECDKVLILFGSANRAPSPRNPFSYVYRAQAAKALFPDIYTAPLNDYLYNDSQWVADVDNTIQYMLAHKMGCDTAKVILYGHKKDGNDYLNWFPQYEYVNINSDIDISGTEVRRSSYPLLPKAIQDDMDYYGKEALAFSNYPYPENLNFCCADNVVECSGHILLIQRKRAPGAGTWALPGGFKNNNETFLECAIRELYEETNLRVPEKVLRGSIVSTSIFDHPARSTGIVRNTMAVYYRFPANPDGSLPRANGADDAQEAKWVSIADISTGKYQLFDDHADIISEMTRVKMLPAYLNLA